jgi:predicted MFS family arabinose efflux permease
LTLIREAANKGWTKPYVYILLIVSMLHFILFVIWEYKFAADPVLPLTIWNSPSFVAMITAVFLTFMGVGVVVWYIAVWNIYIRGYSIFLAGAAYVPLAVCGACAAILSAKAIRYIAAEYILTIGSLATCISLILVAVMPEHQIYWAQVFPAILILAFGPDFIFSAAQIIASVSVKRQQQGIAGSLLGTLLSYGIATGLGIAGSVEYYTNDEGKDRVQGYRGALYFGIGLTGLAMVITLVFVRIPKNRREGWDEDEQLDEPSEE